MTSSAQIITDEQIDLQPISHVLETMKFKTVRRFRFGSLRLTPVEVVLQEFVEPPSGSARSMIVDIAYVR